MKGDPDIIARHLSEIRTLKPQLLALLAANDPDPARRLWLVTQPDGSAFSTSCTPPATLAEIQATYPDAVVEVEPEMDSSPSGTRTRRTRCWPMLGCATSTRPTRRLCCNGSLDWLGGWIDRHGCTKRS